MCNHGIKGYGIGLNDRSQKRIRIDRFLSWNMAVATNPADLHGVQHLNDSANQGDSLTS